MYEVMTYSGCQECPRPPPPPPIFAGNYEATNFFVPVSGLIDSDIAIFLPNWYLHIHNPLYHTSACAVVVLVFCVLIWLVNNPFCIYLQFDAVEHVIREQDSR